VVLTVLMQPERVRHRPGRDFMQMDVPDVPGPTQAAMDSCGDDITGVIAVPCGHVESVDVGTKNMVGLFFFREKISLKLDEIQRLYLCSLFVNILDALIFPWHHHYFARWCMLAMFSI